jgi:carbonic anhydrase/acetyltransferase-like protein (isoleucine patch superfamily)
MIASFQAHVPVVGVDAFVAATASVIGNVTLGARASVWYGTVLRGDVGAITIGDDTNLQDNCVVHVTTDRFDTHVGARVTVGHGVILHGCRIGDDVLVGMGAMVMDGAVIEPWSMVAAGALVTPGTRIPTGMLAIGRPARVARELRDVERAQIVDGTRTYCQLARLHRR